MSAFLSGWGRPCMFVERKAKAPFAVYADSHGRNPCIPPAILRGMVDRILTRVAVERDNREEALPSR